jgi:CubicO group peptidase (beta-lactamase class C family)
MKRKIAIIVLLILTGIAVFLSFPANYYLRNALIHGNVNTDDYKFFENRNVSKGQTQEWEKAAGYNSKDIPQNYLDIMYRLETHAFLIIQNGKIVHERYFGSYSDTSISNSFSVAKSIIGLLVGCALDDSLIKSLDEPVWQYLPSFNDSLGKTLTIRHLLTMSSGLDWDERYTSPFSPTTKAYYGQDLRKLILERKITEQPGKKFRYLSANTQLLAFILEKATGKSVSEYASEKIWKPLGASKDALWSLDKEGGVEKAYCCFNAMARDFARIGQLVLNKGKWNGKQLVSEKYIEEMTSPASWIMNEYNTGPLDYYGYHWWITSFNGEKVVYARGILGQYIFVVPSKNMVIVRLGEKRCSLRTGNLPSDIFVWLNLAMKLSL